MKKPQICLDILIIKDSKILLGLLTEKWNHDGRRVYGVPGRDILFGEKIGAAIKRNIKYDLGCEVRSYKVISVNANYAQGGHFIGVGAAAEIDGELKNLHSEDWEKWEWFDKDKIPQNLFPAAKNVIDSYLQNKVCISE